MTEIAVRETRAEVAMVPAPSALAQWAMDARQAASIAQSLAPTSFVPQAFRGKPAEIAAAIIAGQELGLPPVAALRSMDVIQGTPTLRAHAMRGLVQARGHRIHLVSATPTRVVMRGLRAGGGSDEWQSVEWTIERAQALGLTSKEQWRKQPQTMLIARATGELCRLIAADVLYAMPYASEELAGATEAPDGAELHAPRVTAAEVLGQAQAAQALTAAEPADASVWDAAHSHADGEFDPWCEACRAESSDADRGAS